VSIHGDGLVNVVERVARVLAGMRYSRNADHAGPSGIADADLVDMNWRNFRDDAIAVLKTLREPDDAMVAAAGVPDAAAVWERMARAAIGQ
jgi:hypothetical protein